MEGSRVKDGGTETVSPERFWDNQRLQDDHFKLAAIWIRTHNYSNVRKTLWFERFSNNSVDSKFRYCRLEFLEATKTRNDPFTLC